MRIFLTGASGVIGRRVVPLLLQAGHDITAAARTPARREALVRAGVRPAAVDLFALHQLRLAVAGHDAVINLATHIPHSMARMFMPGGWRENDRIRRVGAANLVDAALAGGVRRFIQESFAPIYADAGDDWIDETAPVRPARYNRTVLDAEAAVQRFTSAGGVGVVLRFAAFYGPDATQLGAMVRMVRHGWAPLLGPAGSYFPSVSHDDAAAAVIAALEIPAGIYNVADDQPLRHRDYVDTLADAVGAKHPHLPPALFAKLAGSLGRTLARSLRVSNRKLREVGGWAPTYPSVREGFPAAVAQLH
jgi:nucleoside-diphosphate-sugar epimerase